MTPVSVDTAAFDQLSWHDNGVHGLRWDIADPQRNEWHSRLILDIDHIVEWVCGTERRPKFRIAPATLVFEDVRDLKLSLDWGESGAPNIVNLHTPIIHEIERMPMPDLPPPLLGRCWRWSIRFNSPEGGLIAFVGSGFRLTLRAEPVLCDEQWYPTDRTRPQPF
jgi:hypothetical protein